MLSKLLEDKKKKPKTKKS